MSGIIIAFLCLTIPQVTMSGKRTIAAILVDKNLNLLVSWDSSRISCTNHYHTIACKLHGKGRYLNEHNFVQASIF